jgi:putative DNA primase/helicase
VTLDVFEAMEIKPRPFIIEGLLRQGESAMLFAKTGVGKTYLAMQLAMGATREGEVLGPYSTVSPCGVLYVDAEMSAADMQARVRNLAIRADGKRFHLLSSELLASGNQAVPNLDEEWRPALLNWLTQHPDIGLVVLDNLSSLTPGVAEDKRLDWDSINQWIIELRRRGLSVVLVHHAGKGGDQRGTSAREDQLNLTLRLTALDDRTTTAFRVDFQKARGLSGEQKKPFVVELVEDEHGRINLVHKNLNDEITAQVAFLAAEGMRQNEIKDKLDISQAGVSRRLKRAESDGLLVVRGAGPEKTYNLTDLGRAATIGMDAEAL